MVPARTMSQAVAPAESSTIGIVAIDVGERGKGARVRLRTEDMSWQELDDEIVVLDLRTSQYLRLNGTAALLWRGILEGGSREALAQTLVDTYDVDRERAFSDVEAFLTELSEHQLLTA